MGKPKLTEQIGAVPRCAACGSERVARDAYACFNPSSGLWELENVFEDAHCHACESSTQLTWSKPAQPPHLRIRELNDAFRTKSKGRGTILLTSGVQSGGHDFVVRVVAAVQAFDAFDDANDPWGEHDFGALEIDDETIFFKFDYYADAEMLYGSENPANEGQTFRVLTIMLASEY